MKTFYLTQIPTFRELAEMCKRIDKTADCEGQSIAIISMETGEVYATRHQCNMWEVYNYAPEKDKAKKAYLRGLITYDEFLRRTEV